MTAPDPATIDAVAAVIINGRTLFASTAEDIARALHAAGWLRTAEDRAVLRVSGARDPLVDAAADAVLDVVGDFLAQGNPFRGKDGETMQDLVGPVNRAFGAYLESLVGSEERRARRVAAGGTEEQS